MTVIGFPCWRKNVQDWNVVVTVTEGGFVRGIRFLESFGAVSRTDYFNVLVMKAMDVPALMEAIRKTITGGGDEPFFLSRVVPVTRKFNFQSREEFEKAAKPLITEWAQELAGKGFHVRGHRRGFKGRLSSMEAEKWLSEVLLETTEEVGRPGRITFEDPDAIVAVETVGTQAGLSLWMREDLKRYPFLRLD
jgi:tRNA(Ser,Leu) C12 N-acetylase TAN1